MPSGSREAGHEQDFLDAHNKVGQEWPGFTRNRTALKALIVPSQSIQPKLPLRAQLRSGFLLHV